MRQGTLVENDALRRSYLDYIQVSSTLSCGFVLRAMCRGVCGVWASQLLRRHYILILYLNRIRSLFHETVWRNLLVNFYGTICNFRDTIFVY